MCVYQLIKNAFQNPIRTVSCPLKRIPKYFNWTIPKRLFKSKKGISHNLHSLPSSPKERLIVQKKHCFIHIVKSCSLVFKRTISNYISAACLGFDLHRGLSRFMKTFILRARQNLSS